MSVAIPQPIRLPDAITIKHGPIALLARFFLAADQYLRDRGVTLTIRYDMDELLRINRAESDAGNWYPLPGAFDPELSGLTPEDSFWICGVDQSGKTVVAVHAVRRYDWIDSSLADHLPATLYGDNGASAKGYFLDCPKAYEVKGTVAFLGGLWVSPEYRRHGLTKVLGRISRAYALATWGVDWFVGIVKREHVQIGMHTAYGYSDMSLGIRFKDSPLGDLDLALLRQQQSELLVDLQDFAARPAAVRAA